MHLCIPVIVFSHVEETGVSCHTFRSSEYSHGGLFLKLDFIINA